MTEAKILNGEAQDWPHYKFLTGLVGGLQRAENTISELIEQITKSDDDDPDLD